MRPELPQKLVKAYRLGVLCARGHDYHGSGQSLRKRSNGGCVQCDQMTGKRQARRKGQRHRARSALPSRPALPVHLQATCFLSPITCSDPTHRYRGLAQWTLRFVDSEQCTLCVTQHASLRGPGALQVAD